MGIKGSGPELHFLLCSSSFLCLWETSAPHVLSRFKAEPDGQAEGQVRALTTSCVIMKNNICTSNHGRKRRPPVKKSKLIKELLQKHWCARWRVCFPGCGEMILKAPAKHHLKPCWNGAAHRYLYDPSINFVLAMKCHIYHRCLKRIIDLLWKGNLLLDFFGFFFLICFA